MANAPYSALLPASPGMWRQDPKTGVFGWAAGTDPNLPVDTTSEWVRNLQIPEYQQSINAGNPGWATTSEAPTSSGWSSSANDIYGFIDDYQNSHAASRDTFLELANLVQQKYGKNRFDYGAQGGLSNNEFDINGKYKVLSGEDSGSPSWYRRGMDDGGGGSGRSNANLSALLAQFGAGYSDPETSNFLDFIRTRVNGLTAPIQDPAYDRYLQSAGDLAARLQTPWTNPNSATTQATLQKILQDVSGAPFTDDQSQAMRAEAFDNLTKSRDADARTTLARMAQLGHGKGSGTIAEALRDVENTYQTNRATNERALTLAGIEQGNRNRQTAATVSQALHDLVQSDQQYGDNRNGQALAILQAINQASSGRRAEEEARAATATTLMGIPVQISDQRLQQALNVLGLTSNSSSDMTSIINALSGVARQSQDASNTQAQNNAAFWQQLGQFIQEAS
jgi:hypothetical protein